MIDEAIEEYRPEEAFTAARADHTFAGQPLRPFSFSRKLAAQSMGCIAPLVANLAEQMRTSGSASYAGALNDAILVTWLCTLRDNSEMDLESIRAKEWTPENALNRPIEARDAAHAWGESNQIDNLGNGNGWEACKILFQIMWAIDLSQFEVKLDPEPKADDSTQKKTAPDPLKTPVSSGASPASRVTASRTSRKNSRTRKPSTGT